MSLTRLASSDCDILLALLLPVLILYIGFKNRSLFNLTNKSHPTFSNQSAYDTFLSYGYLSQQELDAKRLSYARLNRQNKRLANEIGYDRKLDIVNEIIALNSIVADGIAQLMEEQVPLLMSTRSGRSQNVSALLLERLSLVREAFKHFVRDWSIEGRTERAHIFDPILNVLKTIDNKRDVKVLVPGSGLGRLAWEISELGFETTANDMSPYMIFCLRFLLSPKHTPNINHHFIRPYAHWFSHQRTNANLFRSISFPDVLPRTSATFKVLQNDFMLLSVPQQGYDYIVTLFFIDTSLDIISTLRKVYSLLRSGGTWINLGPLLWTGGAQAKLELSLEEVVLTAERVGFQFIREDSMGSQRTVECEYTADARAMMKWIYQAEFWVARKF